MTRRSVLMVCVLVALAGGLPARALASATHPFASDGAARFAVHVTGSSSDVETTADAESASGTSVGLGAWIFRESGEFVQMSLRTTLSATDEAHVDSSSTGTVIEHRDPSSTSSSLDFMQNLAPGSYIVTVGAAADAPTAITATVSASGSATVEYLGETSGGFMLREHDFTGGVTAVVGSRMGLRPKAVARASASEFVGGRLLGWFGAAFLDPTAQISYAGPGGHDGSSSYFFFPGAAGTYTFNIDADVAVSSLQSVWSWGLFIPAV